MHDFHSLVFTVMNVFGKLSWVLGKPAVKVGYESLCTRKEACLCFLNAGWLGLRTYVCAFVTGKGTYILPRTLSTSSS